MLFPTLVILLAAVAQALPTGDASVVVNDEIHTLVARQRANSNELESGPCRPVTFIFARGSTEQGNRCVPDGGTVVGAQTCAALKQLLGSNNVACQGVGGPYAASLLANTFPRGTSDAGIAEGSRLIRLASTKCPNTRITTGGYSQGAALIAASLSDLSLSAPAVANRVSGAVLFGYTRNMQNGGRIPNFPPQKTRIFCVPGDEVCRGTLTIKNPHFSYGINAGEAATFLG